MESEDIDRVVLDGFRAENSGHGARASDVHGYFQQKTELDILRVEIEESIDRLLESHLIEECTEEMDWHFHYRPVNLLVAMARAAVKPRPIEYEDEPRIIHGNAPRYLEDRRRKRRSFWDAVGDLLKRDS